MTVTTALHSSSLDVDIRSARIDLAAAFRWFARLNMHESVANHLSMAVSADGSKFLINPRGRHFSRMCASDLLLLDASDSAALDRLDAPDPPPPGTCMRGCMRDFPALVVSCICIR